MKYFLAGVGIGALIGLVYAPMSGDNTRERIADTVSSVSEHAGKTIENLNDTVSQVLRKKSQREAGNISEAS